MIDGSQQWERTAMSQISFSDAEYAGKRKKTRREVFLDEMEQVVPWKALLGLIEPHCPGAGRGRRPLPAGVDVARAPDRHSCHSSSIRAVQRARVTGSSGSDCPRVRRLQRVAVEVMHSLQACVYNQGSEPACRLQPSGEGHGAGLCFRQVMASSARVPPAGGRCSPSRPRRSCRRAQPPSRSRSHPTARRP